MGYGKIIGGSLALGITAHVLNETMRRKKHRAVYRRNRSIKRKK